MPQIVLPLRMPGLESTKDAIVSTTVAEKEISKYLWNSIVKIGYSPYYFAVSKKSPELYDELNAAITKTLQSDWYYNERFISSYSV